MVYCDNRPSINEGHFKTAFARTKAKHPQISEEIAHDVLYKYFTRIETNKSKASYDQKKPVEIRSLVLNELKIMGNDRTRYHSLIGHYVAEASKRKRARKRPEPTVPIHIEMTGQFAWKI